MAKQKLLRTICLALLIVMVLICAIFIIACSNNQTPGNGQETEQGGEDEIPDNTPDDDDEIPDSSDGEDVVVTSIKLNVNALTLEVGESYTLTATVLPGNATDKSVTWSSSNTAVATVSGGKVTAKAEGAATITAAATNGKMAICTVTIKEPAPEIIEVTSISLNQTSLTLEVGENYTLTATVLPANATDKSVTWSSSELSVATVKNGKVTAIGTGAATITATSSNGKTATCSVTVTNPYADFSFAPSGNGYMVTGYSGANEVVSVPAEYDGKPVTIIGERAFYDCAFITEIVLPDTLIEIGNQAFGYCTSLQAVEIPACTRIGDSVFVGCTSLEAVTLPEGLVTIGDSLFTYCNSLQKVTILSGNISANVFAGCSSLKEIVLDEGVTSVARGAFEDCTSLKYLTMPRVEENTSFNEYYFNIKNSTYTLSGTGAGNLYPAEVKSYTVNIGGVNRVFGIPVTGTDWYYNYDTVTQNGVTYQYSGKPVTVTSWESMYEATVGVSWRRPESWEAEVYIANDSSLEKLTVTNQLISIYDEVFDGCGCEIDIMQKFPVESISVIGETELYLDEFSLDDYVLRVRHTDGWIEDLPIAEHLSEAEKQQLQQAGAHTLSISYGDKSCKFDIVLNLHTFDEAVLEDLIVVVDGTNKYLQVTGVPEGTEIVWENNGQYEVGEYTVTATLKKQYYEDKTLTAHLYIRQAQYNITYVLGVDEAENSNPVTYSFGEGLTLTSPTSNIWDFMGWYADPDFMQEVTGISEKEYGDKTFYAKWQTIFEYSDGAITGFSEYGQNKYINGQIKDVSIPSAIGGQKITSIGERAFYNRPGLTRVTIPDTITSIGEMAFYGCNGLAGVYIGDLSSWCKISFEDGDSNPLSSAHNLYLNGNLVTALAIPNYVADIGSYAFYNCSGLTSVTIPDSVKHIGEMAFYGCNGLTGVYISDLSSWCKISFGDGSSNPLYYAHNLYLNGICVTDLTIPENITNIGDNSFYNCYGLVSVTIPDWVTSIGNNSFYGCTNLKNVMIGSNVASIGGQAFGDCASLNSVTLPDSVKSIGTYAFVGCEGLTGVYISDLSSWCKISFEDLFSNPLHYASNLYLNGALVTELVIPKDVTSIGDYAFYNYDSLVSVTIPDWVTSIGIHAYTYCSNLKNVTIGNSVTSIGSWAFESCVALNSVTIPDSVTFIGSDAFRGCKSLSSVTMGNGLVTVWGGAFDKCNVLTDVYIADLSAWCKIQFKDSTANPLAYAHNLYLNDVLVTELVIPNDIVSIGSYAFYNCSEVTSVVIPDSVAKIGDYAFCGCVKMVYVAIGSSVESIGKAAFSGCYVLKGVYISDLSSWCKISFNNFVSNPLAIAHNLYLNDVLVTELVIPEDVTSIGDYAFYDCDSLTSVTISNNVINIGYSAFYGCGSMSFVRFENPNNWSYNTGGILNKWSEIPSSTVSNPYAIADRIRVTECKMRRSDG